MKEIFSLYLTRDWKAKLGEVMWPRVKITFLQIIKVAILIIDPFQVSYEENNEPTYALIDEQTNELVKALFLILEGEKGQRN